MPNVIIWAYYFWKNDVANGYYLKDPDTYLRQNFQKFIYRLNQPFLRIDQCTFTNVSIFDRPYLESLFGGVEFPDGSFAIDEIEELIKCQQIFMEVVSEIRDEQMFTFPVLTYSLLYQNNHFVDEPFARWCSAHNMKWSDSNFFVSDNVGVLSNCCRLLSDTKKLDAFINSIGGTALSVGSCRVSTINLVRIAYESEFNKKKYLKVLKDRVLLDCKALYSMRYILQRNIEKGLLPNYQDGAVELDKQFCTIGGIGMYEVMDLFGFIDTDEFGNKSYSDEAVEFATQILDTMNEVKDNFDCDFTFNIEMIPAENCAGVICTADNLLFEQDKYFIYSNQWIPLTEQCTIQEKCRLGKLFDAKCGGGCIAHINIENRFPNEETAWDMLNYVASQGVIYFAFTTKINVCEDKHAFIGSTNCPQCGKPIADQYSRVVGFYVPVSSYQKIRKKEFNQRRWYDVLNKDGIMS
jgi:ribonucleoside-triphosphate reductase